MSSSLLSPKEVDQFQWIMEHSDLFLKWLGVNNPIFQSIRLPIEERKPRINHELIQLIENGSYGSMHGDEQLRFEQLVHSFVQVFSTEDENVAPVLTTSQKMVIPVDNAPPPPVPIIQEPIPAIVLASDPTPIATQKKKKKKMRKNINKRKDHTVYGFPPCGWCMCCGESVNIHDSTPCGHFIHYRCTVRMSRCPVCHSKI